MKFISTTLRHTQFETFDDIRPDHNEGKPRFSPSYHETAKKARTSKKHTNREKHPAE